MLRQKWVSSVSSVLLMSLILSGGESLAGTMTKDAAQKEIALLSGGWVGTIKVVPRDIRPVRRFNVQFKLSNPRFESPQDTAYTYDLVVNIAPEGKPLVRANFSDPTTSAYVGGWPNNEPTLNRFFIVPYKSVTGNPNASFLEGCNGSMLVGNITPALAKGSWKAEVRCADPSQYGEDSGEITLQRGQFNESAQPAAVVPNGSSNSSSSQQNTPQTPSNSPNNGIKEKASDLIRSIFK